MSNREGNRHTRVTRAEHRRMEKKQKNAKRLRNLLIAAAVIGVLIFGVNRYIENMYGHGSEIKPDIRTAEELQGDVMNILVCGIDWDEGRTSQNTDVIMYVTLDIKGKKATAFQIPRDTYIGEDVRTGGTGKINAVFGKNGSEEPVMDLINVINKKLMLPVDHYVTLDMEAFIRMVDSIDGGLRMYVPYRIQLKDAYGGSNGEVIIEEPGWYYVSGQTAEQIVRNRNYPNSDIQRLEVQSYFYAAVIKYFMENLNVSDFIKIMNRFTSRITTDMHWTTVASIGQFGFSLKYEDMTIIKPSLHGYDVIPTGKTSASNVLVCEERQWADLLNEYCRPYQDQRTARELSMPNMPPSGEVVRDWGVTATTIQTIGDILGRSPADPLSPVQDAEERENP